VTDHHADVSLTEHERFWIDVIRAASKGHDPVPTLWRTQQLRTLFEERDRFGDGERLRAFPGGLAVLPSR
jgi:hypothetical protein